MEVHDWHLHTGYLEHFYLAFSFLEFSFSVLLARHCLLSPLKHRCITFVQEHSPFLPQTDRGLEASFHRDVRMNQRYYH
jgi:hypothetical protein